MYLNPTHLNVTSCLKYISISLPDYLIHVNPLIELLCCVVGECRRGLPANQRPNPADNLNNYPSQQQYTPPPMQPQQHRMPHPQHATQNYGGGYIQPQPLMGGFVKRKGGGQPARAARHEVSEILMRDLACKLGAEWRVVGTYLGFEYSQIQVLQEQYPLIKVNLVTFYENHCI